MGKSNGRSETSRKGKAVTRVLADIDQVDDAVEALQLKGKQG
jgi:hypothetical protein